MRIYVSGPYRGKNFHQVWSNIMKATKISVELMKKGHAIYCPHWNWFVETQSEDFDWFDYLRQDIEWVSVCDALFLIDHSPGADRELAHAEKMGKKIYRRVADVPEAE
jgi:hypothetical protein